MYVFDASGASAGRNQNILILDIMRQTYAALL